MTHPVLSRIPLLGKFVDERFLEHRRRSSSIAGIVSAVTALLLFEYRLLHDHTWSWDLLSVGLLFVVVKLSLFTWYRVND
jgi:protein-S-isoprenylcysteine O-methyltransferase Ste14